ncbi:hypothetical protein NOR51B_2176 [Luminiphilus syltensis NOR5-1B]|uniref:Ribbon-helix-helix protein CopG domain-containing protein n=1 Tax=Luminiphilus syltensis NOR5-1B TaxID=565045 RepID=B8KUY1_9GAMM|nr:hypothetical protein [Luminiphilus syltensis]EED36227.1 hypothetical protein NOR51B_2176 [Luminiphilus syltensis NOR5-1B]
MAVTREKFATQVDVEILANVREIARSEGRQIQAIVEDALREHIATRQSRAPKGREHVMQAYLKSTQRYSGLYKKLAE